MCIRDSRGTEFLAHFEKYLVEHGVEVDQAALESPWQNGRCERHGGIWKEIFEGLQRVPIGRLPGRVDGDHHR